MQSLKRSPFKVNSIENDPHAFGLRVQEITACAEALYNNRSILISGPRGIGKSSLGSQMQKTLEGDNTLLKRCAIATEFEKHLCIFYACDKGNTIEQMALDILYTLEQRCLQLPNIKQVEFKPTLELNLGVVKASLETTSQVSRRSPSTIATQLISGLQSALGLLNDFTFIGGINIMLDEVDQLAADMNFGHFMKVTHETLSSARLPITFIIAGQQGVYSRFVDEDPSFERIVRHISLSVLESDDADYVLEYAANHAESRFSYDEDAKGLILSLSSGYPYILHLLGDAGFSSMQGKRMSLSDALSGLEDVLRSDKREKYLSYMKRLTDNERLLVIHLSQYGVKEIPAEIPVEWLKDKTSDLLRGGEDFEHAFSSLVSKGFVWAYNDGAYCRFTEELFRVFVSLFYIENVINQERKLGRQAFVEYQKMADTQLVDQLRNGYIDLAELDEEQKSYVIKRVRRFLENVRYVADWDMDDFRELTNL